MYNSGDGKEEGSGGGGVVLKGFVFCSRATVWDAVVSVLLVRVMA